MAFSLLPKEEQYFALFSQMSTKLQEGAAVLQDHLHLAAVIRVDRARRIRQREPVPQGQAGARPYLSFDARRELEHQPRRDEATLTGGQDEIRLCGRQVVARRAGRLPRGERQIGVVWKAENANACHVLVRPGTSRGR